MGGSQLEELYERVSGLERLRTPALEGTELEFRVIAGCELQCGCWEPNPGPLGEWQVPLSTEPPSQP